MDRTPGHKYEDYNAPYQQAPRPSLSEASGFGTDSWTTTDSDGEADFEFSEESNADQEARPSGVASVAPIPQIESGLRPSSRQDDSVMVPSFARTQQPPAARTSERSSNGMPSYTFSSPGLFYEPQRPGSQMVFAVPRQYTAPTLPQSPSYGHRYPPSTATLPPQPVFPRAGQDASSTMLPAFARTPVPILPRNPTYTPMLGLQQPTSSNSTTTNDPPTHRAQITRLRCTCTCGCRKMYQERKINANIQCGPCKKSNGPSSCSEPGPTAPTAAPNASGMLAGQAVAQQTGTVLAPAQAAPANSASLSTGDGSQSDGLLASGSSSAVSTTVTAATAPTLPAGSVQSSGNGQTALQFTDTFLDEKSVDAYFQNQEQVTFTPLKVVSDDATTVSATQTREICEGLFNALAFFDDQAAAPASVDKARYDKTQQTARMDVKERLQTHSGRWASACIKKLYFRAVRFHQVGMPTHLVDGNKTNKGYKIDWMSKFTKRMADITQAIKTNKRVAIDVLKCHKLDSLIWDAESYVERKLINCKGNGTRAKASGTAQPNTLTAPLLPDGAQRTRPTTTTATMSGVQAASHMAPMMSVQTGQVQSHTPVQQAESVQSTVFAQRMASVQTEPAAKRSTSADEVQSGQDGPDKSAPAESNGKRRWVDDFDDEGTGRSSKQQK